jgi:hypothetical protein
LDVTSASDSPETYCREIEAYLCRKNDGHLIRIVGPAFEQVCGWAARGVPLKVAQRGIDRYFERYYAKGPRRRPIRVEFCEPDVLDVFDEWRRAVGIFVGPVIADGSETAGQVLSELPEGQGEPGQARSELSERRHASLPAHLERVIARLTSLRAGEDRALDAVLEAIVRELDSARSNAKGLRGDARRQFLERLRALDRMLIDAAREQCDASALQQLGAEAESELAPFRDRMPREAFEQSRQACIDRLIRDRRRLPVISYE